MPMMWVCLLIFMCIAGIEQTSGQWAFSVIQEGMQTSDQVASLWSGLFWGGMAFGRLTLGGTAVRVGTLRWIQGGVIGAALGGLVYALAPVSDCALGIADHRSLDGDRLSPDDDAVPPAHWERGAARMRSASR